MEIYRRTQTQTVTVADEAKDSEAVEAKESTLGIFYLPVNVDTDKMHFKVSSTKGGTYTFAYSTGSTKEETVVQAGAVGWYPIPTNVMKAGFFKFSCEDTQSDDAMDIIAVLKS